MSLCTFNNAVIAIGGNHKLFNPCFAVIVNRRKNVLYTGIKLNDEIVNLMILNAIKI